jgi:hypothetical protein
VPQRVFQHFPNIKLIIILRNPVLRAVSQFRHDRQREPDKTPETFEEALLLEERFFLKSYQELLLNPDLDAAEHRLYSYRQRGLYLEQLLRWEQYFPKEQFFILHSEEYFSHPKPIYDALLNFLSLYSFNPQQFENMNKSEDTLNLRAETHSALSEFFKPHNEALENHLQREFHWA